MSKPTRRDLLKSAALGAGAAAFGLGTPVRAGEAAAGSADSTTTPGAGAGATPGATPGAGQVDRRKLGRIGTEAGILALGLGSAFTKPHADNREVGLGLLDEALKLGINYFDTARAYGESESIIGPFVEKHRDEIYLVSKSGNRSYDGFMRECETTLNNLKTDRLDLYHLHNLKPGKDKDDDLGKIERGAVKAARKLKEEGVIGHFGITGHSGAQILIDATKMWDPDAIMTILPADRPDEGRYEDDLLPLCREKQMAIIAMKTVRFARESDLKGSDLVRYALSLEGVHSAVVGLDSLWHLKENAQMASSFEPMEAQARSEMTGKVQLALAGQTAPWDRPGYDDHSHGWA